MGRWVRPEVYPLVTAMTVVTGMVVFQLTRNVCMNPDIRVSKRNRRNAVPENAAEGERYSMHAFRRFFSHRRPEVMPSINSFFSKSDPMEFDDGGGEEE